MTDTGMDLARNPRAASRVNTAAAARSYSVSLAGSIASASSAALLAATIGPKLSSRNSATAAVLVNHRGLHEDTLGTAATHLHCALAMAAPNLLLTIAFYVLCSIAIMTKPKVHDSTALADPLAHLLGYHLRRLSVRVMTDLGRALTPLDLNPADCSVLLTIEANPGITQSEVGKAIGILRANMAPLVGALSERGLLEQVPVDGRSTALRVSTKGRGVCREVAAIIADHEDRLFGALGAASRRRLAEELRTLWQAIAA